MVKYDKTGDNHYDTISAFIKSMRGSDPDAAVYYLAKMLKAGEEVAFIARRIMICAAEDVGNADPNALVVATNASLAVERLGMPEGRIVLAQAATYVACAPKSNSCICAIDAAMETIEKENDSLKGVLTKNYSRQELDKTRLGELVTLFTNIDVGTTAAQEKDVLGRVYVKREG